MNLHLQHVAVENTSVYCSSSQIVALLNIDLHLWCSFNLNNVLWPIYISMQSIMQLLDLLI